MNGPSGLLTIEQAAKFLNVSETSLRRWTNDGRLACARIGKKRIRRFKREDLMAFLDMGTSSGPISQVSKRTLIEGIAVDHGTHYCSMYTNPAGRARLAVAFIADGLAQDCACHLVATHRATEEFMAQLRHVRPGFRNDMAAGRFTCSEFAATPSEELDKLEKICVDAVKNGAQTIRLVGNVSDGRLSKDNLFKSVIQYEKGMEERLSKKYPIVILCQYDANSQSGPEIVEILKRHRDNFCYPPERLLN